MGERDFKDAYSASQGPNAESGKTSVNINTINDYSFVEQSYKGVGGFKNGDFLIAHKREAFYAERKQFSHYTNFVNPILRAMIDPVFNSPVNREFDNNELFEMFMKDVNYNNLDIQGLTKLTDKFVRLHSICFLVMDYMLPDDEELSEDYLLKNNVHPYCYIKKAQDVENYKLDFFGRLEEITFIDEVQKVKTSTGAIKEVQTYIRWTKFEWQRVIKKKDDYIVIESRQHDLGELPVAVIYEDAREDTRVLLTDSKFYSLAKINHTIYNQDSERRELQRNQAFSILCIQEEANNTAGKSIGTTNYLKVAMEATNMPQFISPDTNILKELLDQREKCKIDLFTLADQLGVIGITKQAKSGIALSYEFSAYESTLQKSAEIAIRIEDEVVRLFKLYTNTTFEYTAKYNTSYKVGKEENAIKMYDTVMEWPNVPATLGSMIITDTTKLLFPDVEPEKLDVIERETMEKEPEFKEDRDNEGGDE